MNTIFSSITATQNLASTSYVQEYVNNTTKENNSRILGMTYWNGREVKIFASVLDVLNYMENSLTYFSVPNGVNLIYVYVINACYIPSGNKCPFDWSYKKYDYSRTSIQIMEQSYYNSGSFRFSGGCIYKINITEYESDTEVYKTFSLNTTPISISKFESALSSKSHHFLSTTFLSSDNGEPFERVRVGAVSSIDDSYCVSRGAVHNGAVASTSKIIIYPSHFTGYVHGDERFYPDSMYYRPFRQWYFEVINYEPFAGYVPYITSTSTNSSNLIVNTYDYTRTTAAEYDNTEIRQFGYLRFTYMWYYSGKSNSTITHKLHIISSGISTGSSTVSVLGTVATSTLKHPDYSGTESNPLYIPKLTITMPTKTYCSSVVSNEIGAIQETTALVQARCLTYNVRSDT